MDFNAGSVDLITTASTSSNNYATVNNVDDDGCLFEWVAFKENLFPTASNILSKKENNNNLIQFTNSVKSNANRSHFLIGYNSVDNLVAITFVEESRRVSHDRSNSLATSIRYSC